jgi:hypothetical protein
VASQRPFELPEKRTITRYSQTFIRLLYYVMRTAPESVDDINDKTETGVTFSELQLEYVKKVREAVAVVMADDDNKLDTALSSGNGSDYIYILIFNRWFKEAGFKRGWG